MSDLNRQQEPPEKFDLRGCLSGCLLAPIRGVLEIAWTWVSFALCGGALYVIVCSFPYVWPTSLMLSVAWLGWHLARKHEAPWAIATTNLMRCATIALALLLLVVLVVNAVHIVSEDTLRGAEEFLVRLRIRLRTDTRSHMFVFGTIVAALVAHRFWPRLRLVERARWTRSVLSAGATVLAIATSFTFFSQVPLERLAARSQDHVRQRYKLLWRQEYDAVARYLAARSLELSAAILTPVDQQYFRVMFHIIRDEATSRNTRIDLTEKVARSIADIHVMNLREGGGLPGLNADIPVVEPSEFRVPESASEWGQQRAALRRQEAKTRTAEQASGAVLASVKDSFAQAVGLGTPEFKGVLGAYVDELVGEYAKSIFDAVIGRYFRSNNTMPAPGPESDKLIPEQYVRTRVLLVRTIWSSADRNTIAEGWRVEIQSSVRAEIEEEVRNATEVRLAEERAKFERLQREQIERRYREIREVPRVRGR